MFAFYSSEMSKQMYRLKPFNAILAVNDKDYNSFMAFKRFVKRFKNSVAVSDECIGKEKFVKLIFLSYTVT